MVTVAVAGGAGNLGRTIVDAFKENSKHTVIVVVRKVSNYQDISPGLSLLLTDNLYRNPKLKIWVCPLSMWTTAMSSQFPNSWNQTMSTL